jgi:hypothetical protein
MRLSYSALAIFFSGVLGNVEKTIFVAPPAISIPTAHPNLDDLSLIFLSPLQLSARTRLNASFPTEDSLRGTEHWFLLDGLSPGTRYEVRICWLATVSQTPTAMNRVEMAYIVAATHSVLTAHAYTRRSL